MPAKERVVTWSLCSALLATGFVLGMSAGPTAAAARDLPLVEAARAADADAVRALLERQVDVNVTETDGTTALHWAAYKGDLETARVLLAAGADAGAANRYGVTPLALLGDRDVNRADDRGYTALHGAALRGANPIVDFLPERGADLLAESNEGWTPLRIADGVHYTGTVKRADHAAELLREIMQDAGTYDEAKHARDVNSVAVVKPEGRE